MVGAHSATLHRPGPGRVQPAHVAGALAFALSLATAGCASPEPTAIRLSVAYDPRGLALDATHVYWTEYEGNRVKRRAKTLSGGTETIATNQSGALAIAVDATHVYWTNYVGDKVLRRAKTLGAAPIETVDESDTAGALAVDDTHVYWADDYDDRMRRRSKALDDGTLSVTIAINQMDPVSVALDDTYVYWSTGEKTIMRQAKAPGATATTLVPDAGFGAGNLVFDDTHLYWTVFGDDVISRMSRCACDL